MLACWFGLHDYRPVPDGEEGERWIAKCANCPKRSEGLDVARKVTQATRPTTRQGRYQLAKLRERFGMTTAGRKKGMSEIEKFTFGLGFTARDKITGFQGVIVSRCDHLTGCDQYYLQPKVDEKGATVQGAWFDDNRLVIVGSEQVTLETSKTNPDRRKDGACASHPGKG